MIEYIYIVKCPGREDEMFNFFTDARMQCDLLMSKKPIITQVEVERNDFGECTDSHDLGTVWSWEEAMKDTEGGYDDAEPTKSIFTKDDLGGITGKPCYDAEFDALDNSVDFEPEISEVSTVDDVSDNFKKPVNENFDDFDIGPQIDEFTPPEDDLVTLWVAENLNGGEIVAACWTNDENRANRLLSWAFRERTGGDLRDCYIREAEDDEFDYINDTPELLVEACTRKPIPEGMTLKELVEALEENEDEVECTWCEDLFDKSECRYEVNLGWLCSRCEAAIKSRGETLTFREGSYWDFLDEDTEKPIDEDLEWHTYKITFTTKANPDNEQTTTFKTWQSDVEYAWRKSNANIPHTIIKNIELVEDLNQEMSLADLVKDSISHLTNDLGKDPLADDFADEVIGDLERNYTSFVPEDFDKYQEWCSAVACEVSRQVNNLDNLTEASLSDIASAANAEFGSSWNSDDILDIAGAYDDFRHVNTSTGMTPSEKAAYEQEQAKIAIAKDREKSYKNKLSAWKRYKKSKLEELEEATEYRKRLAPCPECGANESFDHETGICLECGFNV